MNNEDNNPFGEDIFLDTPIKQLFDNDKIERSVLRACMAAKPPMHTAGDVLQHLQEKGSFADVPGCRRPGRITVVLSYIAGCVIQSNTPSGRKPIQIKRSIAEKLVENADFEFLTDSQHGCVLAFREEYGHLPMFRILEYYLNRRDASRNDSIMAYFLGLTSKSENEEGEGHRSLAEIGNEVNLSRERVRQIALSYTLPEQLMHPLLWKRYADHSVYYVDSNDPTFRQTAVREVEGLSFAAYAAVLHRTTMMQNVDDVYLARRGWTDEIAAWVNRLSKIASMPRRSESRVSIQGLAQGGKLDTRIKLVVFNQIAPALGLVASPPDAIVLPKNID